MIKVVITRGAWAGRTGTAIPHAAYGPTHARVFSMLVTLDDGAGTIELPVDAIKGAIAGVEAAQALVDSIESAIGDHYHNHPRLGWTVRRDRGGPALRKLRDRKLQALSELSEARKKAGIPGMPVLGAMWLINQADAGYF